MNKILRTLIALLLLFGCAGIENQKDPENDPAKSQPNILLIFCDDLGYGDLSIHGNPDVRTPEIDRLAEEAVRFEPFYAQPVCAPSRAQILTGRHFLKTGIWHVYEERAHLNLEETTLAEVLQDAGYYTAFIGKWTLGRHGPYLPQNRGFEGTWRQALEIDGNIYRHENPVVNVHGQLREMQGWASTLYTDFALAAIDSAGDRPFFIELAHISTHEPYYAPDSLVQYFLDQGFSISLATFYAMVEQLDAETGRLLDELDRRGLSENTLVIFTSDNGPIGNCQNLPRLTDEEMARRNPLDLRGRKGTVFENGIRVAGFFRWPGKFPPRIVEDPADLADLYPTLINLAGTRVPEDNLPVYGRDLSPLLLGEADTLPDRYLYTGNHQVNWKGRKDESGYVFDRNDFLFEGTNLAIRWKGYKYVQFARGKEYGTTSQFNALYYLPDDPGETRDISRKSPAVREKLENELRHWWNDEVLAHPGSYNLPTYYLGYPGEEEVEVHVGSAKRLHGDIDYRAVKWVLGLADWKGNGAGADFRMEVMDPGTYEVLISLTPGDQPCTLEVSLSDHEPALRPVRPDSPWLDRPAGVFDLKSGEAFLKIRMTGSDVASGTGIRTLDRIIVRRKDR